LKYEITVYTSTKLVHGLKNEKKKIINSGIKIVLKGLRVKRRGEGGVNAKNGNH